MARETWQRWHRRAGVSLTLPERGVRWKMDGDLVSNAFPSLLCVL